jgi:hypothetical protein
MLIGHDAGATTGGSKFGGDDDLVFTHPPTGRPLNPSKVRKRFKAAIGSSPLREVRFHDLRHRFGMAAAGVPMRTLGGVDGSPRLQDHADLRRLLAVRARAGVGRGGVLAAIGGSGAAIGRLTRRPIPRRSRRSSGGATGLRRSAEGGDQKRRVGRHSRGVDKTDFDLGGVSLEHADERAALRADRPDRRRVA